MGIKDLNKVIIITDCLTGQVITTIDKTMYDIDCLQYMIGQIFKNDFDNENGIMIKYGYKN